MQRYSIANLCSRSPLRGAWIEINTDMPCPPDIGRSPLRGAWIEIPGSRPQLPP